MGSRMMDASLLSIVAKGILLVGSGMWQYAAASFSQIGTCVSKPVCWRQLAHEVPPPPPPPGDLRHLF